MSGLVLVFLCVMAGENESGGGGFQQEGKFVRGDANMDGKVNISDAILVWGAIMSWEEKPTCLDAADANNDGGINFRDTYYILNFLFAGGLPPPAPFPEPGYDADVDQLSC